VYLQKSLQCQLNFAPIWNYTAKYSAAGEDEYCFLFSWAIWLPKSRELVSFSTWIVWVFLWGLKMFTTIGNLYFTK